MPIFGAIGIASTGATLYRKWLDAVSDNIANMNNAAPTNGPAFRERFIVAREAADGKGVQVGGVQFGDAQGRMVYEPNNPLADDRGYVRYPDIDMSEQMGSLIMAQRGYQANLTVVDRAKTAYEAALQLGRSS